MRASVRCPSNFAERRVTQPAKSLHELCGAGALPRMETLVCLWASGKLLPLSATRQPEEGQRHCDKHGGHLPPWVEKPDALSHMCFWAKAFKQNVHTSALSLFLTPYPQLAWHTARSWDSMGSGPESSTWTHGPGEFLNPRGMSSLGHWGPEDRAPCTTGWGDLVAHPGPGRERKLCETMATLEPRSVHPKKREPEN